MINTKPKLKGKILSLLTAFAMLTALMPTIPAFATISNEYGAFTVTSKVTDGCSYSSSALTISSGGEYTIKQTDGTDTATSDRIIVNVTDGSDVTINLAGVNISNSSQSPFLIHSNTTSNVTIKLSGTNTLKVTNEADNRAGLQKASTSNTLTITSADGDGETSGTLIASGGLYSAGIGGGGGEGKNIIINGGTINATGGKYGAGIGGGNSKTGSYITINGGTVTATGGENGAGIGGNGNSGEYITITGGTVIATGGENGAGIGGGIYSGSGGTGSNIKISGGTVTATGGTYSAGIGGGNGSSGSDITISGGTVTATGSSGGAGIGGGNGGSGSVTISGGTITATGASSGGAGIGGGNGGDGNVTILDGHITAAGDTTAIGAGSSGTSTVAVTGGLFADSNGSTGASGTVYGVTVSDGYSVYSNSDTTSAYPYIVLPTSSTNAFVVTGGSGYSYNDNTLNITGGGTYTVQMNTYNDITSTTTDTIKITASDDVAVTLSGVSISSESTSPITIDADGDVTLTLSGDNTLTSTSAAAINKTSTNNTLTINGGGGLTASGSSDVISGDNIAITGGYYADIGATFSETGSAGGTVYGITVGDDCTVTAIEESSYKVLVQTLTIDETCGDFVITSDRTNSSAYSYSSSILTISAAGEYTIAMAVGVISTSDRIQVTATDVDDDVIITLDGVNISTSGAAFEIASGAVSNVTIKLKGDSSFSSGIYNAGLQKTATNNTLTITSADGYGETTGTLTATGGLYGAGIGGGNGNGKSGSNITIDGGTVTATGGGGYTDGYGGAGIGGGGNGSGNYITITGGTVTATGGGGTFGSGAGIGGGSNANGNNITISGGYITASGANAIGNGSYVTSSNIITVTGGYFGGGTAGIGTEGAAYNISLTDGYTAYANCDTNTSGSYPIHVVPSDGWSASVTYYANDDENKNDDLSLGENSVPTGSTYTTYGDTVDVSTDLPYTYKNGYAQVGWSQTINGEAETSFQIGKDTTLYPVFARTFTDKTGTSAKFEFAYSNYGSDIENIDLVDYLDFVDTELDEDGEFTFALADGYSLPSGLNLSAYGVIYGYIGAATDGDTNVKITVTDSTPYISLFGLDSTPSAVTGTLTVTFNIAKADISYIEAPYAYTNLTYTGEAQELLSYGGYASGGTMYYSLTGEDGSWSTEIPTATDADTYTVYYKAVGDSDHNDKTPENNTVKVTISQATPDVEAPTGLTATYGDTLADVSFAEADGGSWEWVADSSSVGTVGEQTFSAKYSPDDSDNYTTATKDVTITVSARPIAVSWDNASFVYDGTEKTVTPSLTNKVGEDDVTLVYSGNTGTDVDDYTATVTGITGDDSANYTLTGGTNTELKWSIVQSTSSTNNSIATYKGNEEATAFTYGDTITVKATITATGEAVTAAALSPLDVTEFTTGTAAVFYGEKQISDAVSVTNKEQITLTVDTTDLGASDTAYTLTLKYYGDDNMAATTQDFNVTVNKAKPADVVFPTASEITYGATLSESELVDGAGDGTFAWDAPTTVPTVNNEGYSVTFTPNDMDNYDYSGIELTKIVEITVNKAVPKTVVFPTASDITYGAALSESTLSGGAGDGTFAWTDGSIVPTVTNSGYSVTFTPKDTANYDYSGIELTKTVEITVAKADQAAPDGLTVTQPSESSSTGTIAGVTTTMQYSTDGNNWTDVENDPLTVAPGTVYIRYAANDNHNAGAAAEITISASDPSYTTPSGLTATYGDTLADVTLPTADNGVWTWQDDTTSVGNAGTNTFTAVFTPYDGNYNTVTVDVNIEVAQAQPEYELPSSLTAVYGQTLADVELPDGWTWVDSTQSVGEIGDNTFTAVYNKDDSGNYTTITEELTVTVELIELTVEEAPTASKIKKGKTLSASTLSGGVVTADGTEVSGSWAWADGTETMSSTGTYERTAVFTADEDIYGTVEATVSVKVYTVSSGGGSSSASSGGSSTDTSDTSDTSSDSSSTPNVTTAAVADGAISADTSTATAGDTVTVTVTPDEGYEVETVTVTDEDGNEVEVTTNDDGTYAFVMPATAVSVSATFTESDESSDGDGTSSGTHVCPSEKFTDVDTSLWYHEYIDYALENGLMTGTSSEDFEPNTETTRGMIVTILYRLEGEPTAAGESDFTDVEAGAWYADAVAWAAENGIVNGYDNGKFGADDTITREQTAAILYRYAGYKGYDTSASGDISAYTDADAVSGYAVTAMQWAVGTGLITGKDDNTLAPQAGATRAETAAMLARFIEAE